MGGRAAWQLAAHHNAPIARVGHAAYGKGARAAARRIDGHDSMPRIVRIFVVKEVVQV